MSKCVVCHSDYIKTQGCNFVTCPRCNTSYCYVCERIVDDLISALHFSNECDQFESFESVIKMKFDKKVSVLKKTCDKKLYNSVIRILYKENHISLYKYLEYYILKYI